MSTTTPSRRALRTASILMLSAGLALPTIASAQQQRTDPNQPAQRDQNQPERRDDQNQRPQNVQQRTQTGAQPQDPQQRWYDPSEWYSDDFEGFQTRQQTMNQGIDQRTSTQGIDQRTVPQGENTQRTTPQGDLNRADPRRTDPRQSDPNMRSREGAGNQQGDEYALYAGQPYDRTWWNDADQAMLGDGYYDGYYDGYNDDEFGYDHFGSRPDAGSDPVSAQRDAQAGQQAQPRTSPPRYDEGYSSGYYDGFYDKQRGYESDWSYYMSPEAQDPARAQVQERERIGDERRMRGERARDFGTGQETNAQDMRRYRGTVSRVEPITAADLGEEMQGRSVVRITLDNGETFLTDLGPGGDPGLISQGDRLSVLGAEVQQGQRSFINASRMRINDRFMWNTRDMREPMPVSDPNYTNDPARSDDGSRPGRR